MPGAKFTFASMRVDGKGYLRALDRRSDKIVIEAARVFLRKVAQIVPTSTGTSQGSLRPAASFLGLDLPPIEPKSFEPGLGPDVGASLSSHSFTRDNGILRFIWEHDVPWFEDNDKYHMNFRRGQIPTPWDALPRAELEAQRYMDEAVKTLPQVREYIGFTTTTR